MHRTSWSKRTPSRPAPGTRPTRCSTTSSRRTAACSSTPTEGIPGGALVPEGEDPMKPKGSLMVTGSRDAVWLRCRPSSVSGAAWVLTIALQSGQKGTLRRCARLSPWPRDSEVAIVCSCSQPSSSSTDVSHSTASLCSHVYFSPSSDNFV